MHTTTATKVLLVFMLNSMSSFVNAQNTKLLPSRSELTEREVMYYRYLEFASSFKGGTITPHWMTDGSSFWYAPKY